MDTSIPAIHRERARAFALAEVAPSVTARDRDARWDGDLFRRMGEAGLFAPGLSPDRAGAISGQALGQLQMGFGEGSADPGLSLAWSAHTAGCVVPLAHLGSEAQRRRWLPPLCRGEAIGAWAHVEPEAAGEPTRAIRHGAGFIVSGRKTWVVNGGVADLFIVTAATDPARRPHGVSTFVLPRATPGLSVQRLDAVGMRTAVLSEVVLDGCEVGEEHLLGAEGTGLTGTLPLVQRWERVGLFAPWIGLLRLLLDRTIAEIRGASRLGRPLSQSQSARAALAEMKIRIELCARMATRAASCLEPGSAAGDLDIAVARLFIGENVQQIVREALSIHGLAGAGAERLVSRLHRDAAVIAQIGGGNDLVRSAVAGSLLQLG